MWIENLLSQINISNINQLGLKKDTLTEGCFLELINSILGSKNLLITNNICELEKANYLDKNVEMNDLTDVFIILSGLLNSLQEVKDNKAQEYIIENSDRPLKEAKIFERLYEQENCEIISKLQDLFSQHPEVFTLINNNFFTTEKIFWDNNNLEINIEKEKKSLIVSDSFDREIDPENIINLSTKDYTKQIVNFSKDVYFKEVDVNKKQGFVIQENDIKIDQSFLNNSLSDPEQIMEQFIEGINKKEVFIEDSDNISLLENTVNVHSRTKHNHKEDLNIDNAIHEIHIIKVKENDHDKSDTNFDNNFNSMGRYSYQNVEKMENNDTVMFKNIMEVKNNEDVKHIFKEQILIKKNNDNSITLILEPKDIGKVRVNLTINDGIIKAEVYPNTEMARNFFKENMDKIISTLGSEGINLGQFTLKDDRGNRNNGKEIEKDKRLNIVDPILESKQEIKRSANLNGLSVYA